MISKRFRLDPGFIPMPSILRSIPQRPLTVEQTADSPMPLAQAIVPLAQAIGQTYIIAYREDTDQLTSALNQTGLSCEVLRQQDCPEYQHYSASYRCFLNQQQAWLRAAQSDRPTLIMEADFVPVVELGQLPLPFDLNQPNVGICWLYTCAPQIYSVSATGFARGFSTGLVAYILTPKAAQALCELAQLLPPPSSSYTTFDSQIDRFLGERQFQNFIPFRNYGEHGGKSNPEHRRNGLSGNHQADVLWDRLAFLPAYAATAPFPQLTYVWVRSQARLKGVIRLLIGKFLRPQVLQGSSVPERLIGFALGRQLTLRL